MPEIDDEVILNQNGEPTDLAAPADFGKGLAFFNPDQMPNLDEAEVGISIQPESIEFKNPGDNIRAVFNGFTELKVKDQVNKGQYVYRKTAVLQTKTGVKINMGANLLKQLAFVPVGTAVQITYKGEEKTGSGNKVKVYDVHLLNVPRVNVPVVSQTPQIAATTTKPTFDQTMKELGYEQEPAAIVLISPHGDEAAKIANAIWNIGERASAIELWKLFPDDKIKLTAQEIKDTILAK